MVHDIWSTMFNWCYKTVYKELKIGRVRLKGGGVPWYYSLGDTLQLHYWYYIYTNSFVYISLTFFPCLCAKIQQMLVTTSTSIHYYKLM